MPSLPPDEARHRLEAARIARLATVRADGRPHVVPVVFALDGNSIHLVADPKPKDGLDLLRHRNIAANPAVSLLVDEYHEPWRGIWWVRVDGTAHVVEDGPERDLTIELLRAKYADYEEWTTPFGAATIITAEKWRSWTM